MHTTQKKLLDLISERKKIENKGFSEIGRIIGVESAQKIKHHLLQLEKRGFIKINRHGRKIDVQLPATSGDRLISIPIVGAANCGTASILADECIEGYLQVSPQYLPKDGKFFAVSAVGQSMNQANVSGKTIDDGDYVVVDSEQTIPNENDYVLSVIDGAANIKKFFLDKKNNQVVLISESSEDLPPIYIHPEEDGRYLVNGKVVAVFKKPAVN